MATMRMGVILPGGTAREQLELAQVAEEAGWDGVFVWEAAYGVDAWGLLSAIATRTSRMRLGTLLTPLPWRRPWKVASQVATLDQLSEGRSLLTVGLGAVAPDLPSTGEPTDLRERAGRLDEGIDLIRALLDGGTSYRGRWYAFELGRDEQMRVARPVQERIPIWVVGLWPRERSMARVIRCDGIVPQFDFEERETSPSDIRDLRAWLTERGASEDFDVIGEGETPAGDPREATDIVAPWADAGCTWWLETRWEMPHHSQERLTQVRDRLEAGPPSLA